MLRLAMLGFGVKAKLYTFQRWLTEQGNSGRTFKINYEDEV